MAHPVESSIFPTESSATTFASAAPSSTASTIYPPSSATTTYNAPPSTEFDSTIFDSIFADPPPPPTAPPPPPGQHRRESLPYSESAPSLGSKSRRDHDDSFKKHEPPPQREVKRSHHHHHVINVDSETDLTKMRIDEKKVNFLPYNPPVAISQTGLIQSIGKPFSSNHAKHLPDPGDEFKLTRRVSQVRLNQVTILGDVHPKVIEGLAGTVKLFSLLIGITGVVFFGFVLAVATMDTPMQYPLYFLDNNPICKFIHIAGAVQPFAVAPYCRYALVNLKHIRGYFLRVPFALLIPTGVLLCGSVQFTGTVSENGDMKKFLVERMKHYFLDTYTSDFGRSTWDGIQESFSCCGYEKYTDWNAYNASFYPNSCCKKQTQIGCTSTTSHLIKDGCKSAYKNSTITVAAMYCTLGIIIIVLEVLSVIFMRSLYACISKEVYDERSSLNITCGNMCSMCDIEDTDEELEFDKHVEHEHDHDEDHHHDDAHKTAGKTVKLATSAVVLHSPHPTPATHSVADVKKTQSLAGVGGDKGRGRGTSKVAPAPGPPASAHH